MKYGELATLHPSSLIPHPYRMAEMTVAEAAERLGVSVETIRRWIRSGQLVSRRDPRGHVTVEVLAGSGRDPDAAPSATQSGHRHSHPVDLRRQLAHVNGLLAEVRRQRDQLEAQVAAQAHLLEQAAAERPELLRRLKAAQEELRLALALAGGKPPSASTRPSRRRPAGAKE